MKPKDHDEDPPEDILLRIVEFDRTTVQSLAESVSNLHIIIKGLQFDLTCAIEDGEDRIEADLRLQLTEAKQRLADYQAQMSQGTN